MRHVRDWLDGLQEADTTKVKHLNILKAFFSYVTGLEHPLIKRSPILDAGVPVHLVQALLL